MGDLIHSCLSYTCTKSTNFCGGFFKIKNLVLNNILTNELPTKYMY